MPVMDGERVLGAIYIVASMEDLFYDDRPNQSDFYRRHA